VVLLIENMRTNSWRPDWIVETVTNWVTIQSSPQQTSIILAALLFLYYWVVPGLLCAFDGSFLNPQTLGFAATRVSTLVGFDLWHYRAPSALNILYYTDDLTHFLFTLCLMASAYLANLLFDKIEMFATDLKRAGCHIDGEGEKTINGLYSRCRALFRSPSSFALSYSRIGIRIAGLVAGLITFRFFNSIVHQPCSISEKCWWGQIGHGIAGTYYSVAIAGLVYFATEGLAAVLIGATMINLILRKRCAKPNIFAQDLANGMSPVGDFVLTSFIISLVGSVAVFIVLRLGYFGVENLVVIWALIIVATLFVPLATLFPMYSAMYLIAGSKHSILQNINLTFESESPEDPLFYKKIRHMEEIQPAIALYKHVADLNILPFDSHKAFISGIALTGLIVQTGYNLVKLVH
jgi:hypothetical protein